jgi:hypothetical protein
MAIHEQQDEEGNGGDPQNRHLVGGYTDAYSLLRAAGRSGRTWMSLSALLIAAEVMSEVPMRYWGRTIPAFNRRRGRGVRDACQAELCHPTSQRPPLHQPEHVEQPALQVTLGRKIDR